MLSLVTTSRKAAVGAIIAFLSPVAALFASEQELNARVIVASLMAGLIGGLGVWSVQNTEPYEPRHAERTGSSVVH